MNDYLGHPFVDAKINPELFVGDTAGVTELKINVEAYFQSSYNWWPPLENQTASYAVILVDGAAFDPTNALDRPTGWYLRQDVEIPMGESDYNYASLSLRLTEETLHGVDYGYGPIEYVGEDGAPNPDFSEFVARIRSNGVLRVVNLDAPSETEPYDNDMWIGRVEVLPVPLNSALLCSTAPCGEHVVSYTVSDAATTEGHAFGPHGPASAPHFGAFAIHESGQISWGAGLASNSNVLSPKYSYDENIGYSTFHVVVPTARFLSRTNTGFSTVSTMAFDATGFFPDVASIGVPLFSGLGGALEWASLTGWTDQIPDGATHWLLEFPVYKHSVDPNWDPETSEEPATFVLEAPDQGLTLYADCTIVIEDGAPPPPQGEGSVPFEFYFDGDSDFARWEGTDHNATSVISVTSEPPEPPAPPVPDEDPVPQPGDVAEPEEEDLPTPRPPVPVREPAHPSACQEAERAFGRVANAPCFCVRGDIQLGDLVFNKIDDSGILWVVSDVDGWWNLPDPEIPDYSRGLADGSFESNGRYTARYFTLSGSFIPESKTQVREARDKLIRAADLCHKGTWFATHEEDATRASKVWLSGRPEISTVGLNGRTNFSIGLKAPDPIKYGLADRKLPGFESVTMLSSSTAEEPASGREYPREYPWSYQAGQDVPIGTLGVAANVGNTRVSPTIKLTGPTTGPVQIHNRTTGQTMRVKKILGPTETLIIDCLNKTVQRNALQNQRWYLDTVLDWIYLEPGTNEIRYIDEAAASGGKLTVEWRSGWIG